MFMWDLGKPSDHPGSKVLRASFESAIFSADNKTILGTQLDGGLALWDVQTLSEVKRWRENSPTNTISIRLAPDGRSVALFERGNLAIWDLHTEIRTTLRAASAEPIAEGLFTHNGNYLVTVVRTQAGLLAEIWSVREARLTGTFSFKSSTRSSRRFAAPTLPNCIVVADMDGLRFWDVEKPGKPPRFVPDRGEFSQFQTSPDHKLGACAFSEGYLRLWDMASLQPIATLQDFLLGAHSVAFAPDCKRLVAGSNGIEALKLWDVETRQEVLTLSAEGQLFENTAFSPDGRYVFGINAAGTLYLWSAPSWKEIADAEAKEKREVRKP